MDSKGKQFAETVYALHAKAITQYNVWLLAHADHCAPSRSVREEDVALFLVGMVLYAGCGAACCKGCGMMHGYAAFARTAATYLCMGVGLDDRHGYLVAKRPNCQAKLMSDPA
eukprot:1088974-Pelagomonas_calceolata.AAC.2